MDLIHYMSARVDSLLEATLAHVWLVLFSMAIASVIAVICGICITLPPWPKKQTQRSLLFGAAFLIGCLAVFLFNQLNLSMRILLFLLWVLFWGIFLYRKKFAQIILYIDSIIMTIPSIALFGLFIPILGIGFPNAVVALVLYAQLPIIRNTYAGITGINPVVIDAAKGMGMSNSQIIYQVKLPMALPVIMAGLRTATVMIVGIAAIASYVGAKSLGEFIFRGISSGSVKMIMSGAIWVALFAVITDFLLGQLEKYLIPKGLRK